MCRMSIIWWMDGHISMGPGFHKIKWLLRSDPDMIFVKTSRFAKIWKFTQRKCVIRDILIFSMSIHRIGMLSQCIPLYCQIMLRTKIPKIDQWNVEFYPSGKTFYTSDACDKYHVCSAQIRSMTIWQTPSVKFRVHNCQTLNILTGYKLHACNYQLKYFVS